MAPPAAVAAGLAAVAVRLAAMAPLAAGIIAFALARGVLLPGQGFWDTGEFQTVAPLFGTAHPTGYPSYVILGWLASIGLAPVGEPALRMNLLSSILLGLAAGLAVVLVRQLTGRTIAAFAAGLLLALTPIPWRMGAFADPHTLHLAFLAGLLVLLVGWEQRSRARDRGADRWLAGAAILYGVMLGNHTLTVLLAPGIALYVLAVDRRILSRPRFIAACAGLVLLTTGVLYLQLPIRAAMDAPIVYGHPDTLVGFLYVVLGAQFHGELVDPFGDLGRKAVELADLAVAQLGALALLIPPAFLVVAARRPRFALLSGTWLLVTCWFAASYTNASIERYYLGPALIVVAWLAVGAATLADALAAAFDGGRIRSEPGPRPPADDDAMEDASRPADALGPASEPRAAGPGIGASLATVAVAALLVLPAALAAPATAARVDMGHDTRAGDWSRWVLETVDDRAVVVSWWSYSTPLWYRTLVLGERPDVLVLDDRDRLDEDLGSVDDVIRANLGTRPVYLVRAPAELATLRASWVLEEIDDPSGQQALYRVIGPREGDTGAAARPATMTP